jgi:hypothetical protein
LGARVSPVLVLGRPLPVAGDVELPFVVRHTKDEVSLRVGDLVGLMVVVALGLLEKVWNNNRAQTQ